MRTFLCALLVGVVTCRPSDLSGLEHVGQHHDHHDHGSSGRSLEHRSQVRVGGAEVPISYSAQPVPYEEPQGPPRPYSFTYQAGRYPDHVDRQHSETRGEDGVVHGSYEYVVHPLRQTVRVDYTADEYGFHPQVQGPIPQAPRESAAVVRAREKHAQDSARIVAQQQRIAQEHARLRAALEAQRAEQEAQTYQAQPQEYTFVDESQHLRTLQ